MQAMVAGHEQSVQPDAWEARVRTGKRERRRAVSRGIARTLSVIVGLAGAAFVLVAGGFGSALTGCVNNGETTAFCPGSPDLATALEIATLVPGILAPLVGGIVSCVTCRKRWLAGGIVVGALAMTVLVALWSGQQGLLT